MTKQELEAALAEAKADAQDIFHELSDTRAKLAALVDKTGDSKPWLLLSAGAAIGSVAAALLFVVL